MYCEEYNIIKCFNKITSNHIISRLNTTFYDTTIYNTTIYNKKSTVDNFFTNRECKK
jgi:hypothetical protein